MAGFTKAGLVILEIGVVLLHHIPALVTTVVILVEAAFADGVAAGGIGVIRILDDIAAVGAGDCPCVIAGFAKPVVVQ